MAYAYAYPNGDDTIGIPNVEPGTATTHAEVLGDSDTGTYVYSDSSDTLSDIYTIDNAALYATLAGATINDVVLQSIGYVEGADNGEQYRVFLYIGSTAYYGDWYTNIVSAGNNDSWMTNPASSASWVPSDFETDIMVGIEMTANSLVPPPTYAIVQELTLIINYTTADGTKRRATCLLF